MTSNTKIVVSAVIALVVAFAIYGAYQYPQVQQLAGTAGTTFSTAKIATINITPSSSSATSTSLLNTDANDRVIESAVVTCSGLGNVFAQTSAGVATFRWTFATTSTNAPATNSNTNAWLLDVATSSTNGYTASTTINVTVSRVWASGSYLTIQSNATSSTAVCQAGVHYLAQ